MARMKATWRRAARTKMPQCCAHCGATEGLTLDHIIPRVYGGTNVQENLQLLCPPCHVEKSKKEMRHRHPRANQKAGEKLRRKLALDLAILVDTSELSSNTKSEPDA